MTSPAPMPATMKPGIRCVHAIPGSIPRISSSETPTKANPGPIKKRVGTESARRPAIAAVRKIGPESTRKRTPISIAEKPSPSCR